MIEIKLAKPEDIPAITKLAMVVIQQMDLELVKKIDADNVERLIKESALDPSYRYSYTRAVVAYEQEQVVGVAFYYPNEDEPVIDDQFQKLLREKLNLTEKLFTDLETYGSELYLDSVVVNPNFRGLGIGTKLIKQLPEIARKLGKKVIGLAVDDQNPKAKKLYQKIGFKEVTRMKIGTHDYTHMYWEF